MSIAQNQSAEKIQNVVKMHEISIFVLSSVSRYHITTQQQMATMKSHKNTCYVVNQHRKAQTILCLTHY